MKTMSLPVKQEFDQQTDPMWKLCLRGFVLLIAGFCFSTPVLPEPGAPPRCNCYKVQGLCNATVRLTEIDRQKQGRGNLVTVRADTTTDTQHCARVDYAAHVDATSQPQPQFVVLTEGAYSNNYTIHIDAEVIRPGASDIQCRICFDSNYDKDEQDLSSNTASAASGHCEMLFTDREGRSGMYTGQCINGVPNGHGTHVAQGNQYTGDWLDGFWNGHGKTTTSDGGWCENEFLNDMRNGPGTCEYPDGSWFTGEFRDDLVHGYGSYTDASGKHFSGYWENGKQVR